MAHINDARGRSIGFEWLDLENIDVTAADYSPIENNTPDELERARAERGFYVLSDTDGTVDVITAEDWYAAYRPASLSGLTPITITLIANQPFPMRVVAVKTGGTLTSLQIGHN